MDRIITLFFLTWLAAIAVGIVIALLPVLAFLVGFVGVLLIFAFLGRWASSWLW